MRILQGHDYYDAALAYGHDESIVFVREKNLRLPNTYPTDGIDPPPFKLGSFNLTVNSIDRPEIRYNLLGSGLYRPQEFTKENVRYSANIIIVIVAGIKWRGIRVIANTTTSTSSKIFWQYAQLEKYLNGLGVEVYKSTKTKNSYYFYQDKEFDENFFGPIELSDSDKKWMIDNRYSIITYDSENTEIRGQHIKHKIPTPIYFTWRVNGDNLKDLEFFKAVDAYTMFQQLSMWIGGVLPRSPNPMVEITDDKVKAHKHGFDKWSFRKPPEK